MQTSLNLDRTLEQCTSAIENGEDVVITKEGTWYIQGWFISLVHRILGFNDAVTLAVNLHATLLSKTFTKTDQGLTAVEETTRTIMVRLIKATKKRISLSAKIDRMTFQALEGARNSLNPSVLEDQLRIVSLNRKIRASSNTPSLHAKAALQSLQMPLETLPLSQQSIEETPFDSQDLEWLTSQVLSWQERQFPYVDYIKDSPQRDDVIAKLTLCCRYKKFITRCRKNEALLQNFINSIIKNMPDSSTDSVHLFMQVPHIIKTLQKTSLDKRIREIANDGIRFIQRESSDRSLPVKDILLRIHSEHQSISDENATVQIGQDERMQVKEVFAEFMRQNVAMIKLEYLQSGVESFDGRLSFDLLRQDDWWKHIPIVRRMTREEISEAYGTHFDTGESFISLRASRSSPTLEASDNHAWVDIALPLEDGTFSMISVGKYTEPFPETIMESLHHIFRSHKATLTVIDFNLFMSQRERASLPFPPLNHEQFENLMGLLKNDFQRSLNGELVFQAQGDNCAAWVVSLMKRLYPDLEIDPYRTAIQDLTVPSFLMPIILARHVLPTQYLWNQFRIACCVALGALDSTPLSDGQGGTKNVRLFDNPSWREGYLEIPSALFFRKGELAHRLSEYPIAN